MRSRTAVWMLALAALAATALCRPARATGIMVPEDPNLPPLAIKSHRVNVRIEGNVATTNLTQVFLNSTDQRLEATYIFPLPREAALTDFAMFINGKRQSGEVVEADRARQIYQDIVRRLRDPGLLEYLDSGLLRMRVFPIEPRSETKVEVTYSHPLPFESGVYEYTFPLKTGQRASQVLEDFAVSVEISGKQPIKNVYSPTHDVGVTRKDDYHALAGFEKSGAMLDTDFTLFYGLSREDFGMNLLTHRRPGEDGYFALMISPSVEIGQDKVMPKDVCFVIDTSGSMQEENRIASARDAVRFCLKSLNPGDRFALVTFSTGVEVFGDGLTEATPEAVAAAVAHVEKLEARGGTDLCGAVTGALGIAPDSDRPYLVVLATDGKPTVGVTDADEIVRAVQDANGANVRVFAFGIAEDLNVPLLDRIAEATRGYSDYVAPGREIETTISNFFRKVSHPVLSNLELDFGDVRVTDVYPSQVPDLFRGGQVIAFGRYSGNGDIAVKLSGTLRGERQTFAYDASFPKENGANTFLTQLWARRKVGYLLDQIRLHGESKELTDEVVRLSKEYGIATPYTSYLVLEDDEAYRQHGIMLGAGLARLREAGVVAAPAAQAAGAPEGTFQYSDAAAWGAVRGRAEGEQAVKLSEHLRVWKEADAVGSREEIGATRVQRVGDKTFLHIGGAYVDTAFTEEMDALTIKWGSDAYFAVLDAVPDVKDYLALGESLVVVISGKALIVADEGKEEMTADQIKAFFGK